MNRLDYLLKKLAEEASELSVEAIKASVFGLNGRHPHTNRTNLERIQAELVDLVTVVDMLNDEHETALQIYPSAEKRRKVDFYYTQAVKP